NAETDLGDENSEKRGGFRVYQRIMPQFRERFQLTMFPLAIEYDPHYQGPFGICPYSARPCWAY
ncbi:hypothetical protein, partial [Bacteroides sp.]|uniref:hypothetical protein n=1 Tax=Bacteroides sp. TaxID=29523 RepID=UPI0023BEF675